MAEPMLPYGRQTVDEDDIASVIKVLKADFLTTGPEVDALEADLASATGAAYAAVVSSGTAALHAAYAAVGVDPGDEIVTSPLTFVATANAALFLSAKPVFADIDPATGLLDPVQAEAAIGPRTRAIVPVDYGGLPADYDAFREITSRRGLRLVADAAHSLGASVANVPVGQLADATALSFHPVKIITTGEGGAVLTNDSGVHQQVLALRSHGMVKDSSRLSRDEGPWYMEMQSLGYNYRLTDLQSALGRAQLQKLPRFLARRRQIAERYDRELREVPGLQLPEGRPGAQSAWHLYVLRVNDPTARRAFFEGLRGRGIGVQVHYIPVYLHPHYAQLGYRQGLCPNAEDFYSRAVTIPLHPSMDDGDVDRVVATVAEVARWTLN
jgi:UDP-4-amino-4,6-dideoxy-N-acetyl-beta-L-altrosamine transaminase